MLTMSDPRAMMKSNRPSRESDNEEATIRLMEERSWVEDERLKGHVAYDQLNSGERSERGSSVTGLAEPRIVKGAGVTGPLHGITRASARRSGSAGCGRACP